MQRFPFVLSSLLLVALWSAPIDAAEEQRRAQRRGSGASQGRSAPQRSAPRASAPRRQAPAARQPRGNQGDRSARRAAPRRAPRPATSARSGNTRSGRNAPPANGGNTRVTTPSGTRSGGAVRRGGRPDSRGPTAGGGRGATRVVAPTGGGRTGVNQAGRSSSRNARSGQVVNSRRGTGQYDRRPSPGQVGGSAVRRPPLSARPIVVNNYGGRGGRGRHGYTTYRGRHGYGSPGIYGSAFYFPGYSTFNIGFGVGYGYGYGYGGYGYGYDPYGYGTTAASTAIRMPTEASRAATTPAACV